MRSSAARPRKYLPPPTEEEKAEFRRWWLEDSGFNLAELRDVARMVFPDLPSEQPWLALAS